jgi:Zn finger protein HypA/HybF involved in hydrogenase expression
MQRVAVLDDVLAVADILAAPLRVAGYDVLTDLTSIDFERVLNFKPELIILGLHRRIAAFDRPIQRVEEDLFGIKPLQDMEHYPAISVMPILLVSTGLKEADIPTSVNYDSFLIIPEEAELYLPKVKELIETVKTRRKISQYVCPNCGSRLVYTKSEKDLFCPRCHTTVSVVDDKHCLVTSPGLFESKPCEMAAIRPHKGDTSDQAEERATHSESND